MFYIVVGGKVFIEMLNRVGGNVFIEMLYRAGSTGLIQMIYTLDGTTHTGNLQVWSH